MNKSILAIMATSAIITSSCTPSADNTADDAPIIGRSELVPANHRLTPEILQELGKISEVTPSPDGTKLLYGVSYVSVKENRSNRELFVMNIDGSDNHAITHTAKSESNAVWSADGSEIYFMSSESGSSQIWKMNADGSNRQQISDFDRSIEGFVFSPDFSQVIMIAALPMPKTDEQLFEGLDKTTGRIYEEMNYRHWNDWVMDYPHPYLAKVVDGKVSNDDVKDILEGEPYECPMRPFGGTEAFAWTPDGKQIVYSCRKETGTDYAFSTRASLYLYNVADGTTVDLHPGDHGYDTNPAFSPDGKYLAFQSMARNGYESDKNRLMIIDMATREMRDLTASYDNNCDGFVWNADSRNLTFTGASYGTSKIFSVNVDEAKVAQVSADVQADYGSVTLAGNQIIATRHSMASPDEIFALNEAGEATQLSFENKAMLDQIEMGRVEPRWMKTTNGDDMLVWVAYPVGFDETLKNDPDHKFPTLLYCQGGPESAVSQFWSTRWNVAIMQANGYVVVLPNRHGVPGFGQAYNEQIAGDFAGQCMKDYFTAIDNIAKEPWCDSDRLGAVGASFGGYSVYWLAGHHDNRFKCFIAHCGIYNTESMYAETEEMWFANWDYGGAPWDKNPNKSYTDSPHKSITKWNTPILVIHNEYDFRIPVTQGMQAFNAARMRGVPAKFLYFPDECHWVTKPQNGVLWQRVFFDWLDKYLK